MNKHPWILCDLDGTLLDISTVHQLIPDWDAFHEASLECRPIERIVQFVNCLAGSGSFELMIVTGKPDRYRARVDKWLRDAGIYPSALLMRGEGCFDSDPECKVALVKKFFGTGWQNRIAFALEDRDKMVEAWRTEGILTLQCAASLY